MRINVYSQELTKEFEVVNTTADTGIEYFGIRMVLHSSERLHHTADDDDRSAITLWIPEAKSYTPKDFAQYLFDMGDAVLHTFGLPPFDNPDD
jgi:hypothetical protein